MKRRASLLTLALCALPAVATAFPVTALQDAGPVAQRYNVVILGDGYRSQDQTKLTNDAKAFVNALFDDVPYKPYRRLFNIKLIQSVSQDQGAKGGTAGGSPNTLFGANYNCNGVSQLICVDDGAVLTAAATDDPDFDLALVIVNDAKYGGSGGNVPVVSTDSGAPEILRHELGHNIAGLGDEYSFAYPGYPACPASDCTEPNVTTHTVRAEIKWLDWIDDATPVPTPSGKSYAGIGLFEGARYMTKGFYRPIDSACKMQSLGQPFCSVCAEALVRSFWNLKHVHLIDEATPAMDVTSTKCESTTFSVKTPTVTPSTLSFSWTVDGEPRAEATATLVLAAGAVSEGSHEIAVTVKDGTALVRSDPMGSLSETHAFEYTVPACAAPEPDAGVGGSSAGAANSAGNAAGGSVAVAGTSGQGGATSAGGVSSSSGSPGSGGATPPSAPRETVGCNCRIAPPERSSKAWLAAALLGFAALARRRRS